MNLIYAAFTAQRRFAMRFLQTDRQTKTNENSTVGFYELMFHLHIYLFFSDTRHNETSTWILQKKSRNYEQIQWSNQQGDQLHTDQLLLVSVYFTIRPASISAALTLMFWNVPCCFGSRVSVLDSKVKLCDLTRRRQSGGLVRPADVGWTPRPWVRSEGGGGSSLAPSAPNSGLRPPVAQACRSTVR